MGAPLRYGSLPFYLLPRKAPVFVYSTAYHPLLHLIYTATTALLIPNTSSSFLVQSPTSKARYSSQPAPCSACSTTRKHLQPLLAIDGYVQHISLLITLSAEPSLVTTEPKHVF